MLKEMVSSFYKTHYKDQDLFDLRAKIVNLQLDLNAKIMEVAKVRDDTRKLEEQLVQYKGLVHIALVPSAGSLAAIYTYLGTCTAAKISPSASELYKALVGANVGP